MNMSTQLHTNCILSIDVSFINFGNNIQKWWNFSQLNLEDQFDEV